MRYVYGCKILVPLCFFDTGAFLIWILSYTRDYTVPYLWQATETDAKEVTKIGQGYTHGTTARPIVPLVVSRKDKARWVFFIVDTGGPLTYLSAQVRNCFCLNITPNKPRLAKALALLNEHMLRLVGTHTPLMYHRTTLTP